MVVCGTLNCWVCPGDAGEVVLLPWTNVPSTVLLVVGVVLDVNVDGEISLPGPEVVPEGSDVVTTALMIVLDVKVTEIVLVILPFVTVVTETGGDATAPATVLEVVELDNDAVSVADTRLSVDEEPLATNSFTLDTVADKVLSPLPDTTKSFEDTEVVVLAGSVAGTVVVTTVVKVVVDCPDVMVISSVVVMTLPVVAKATKLVLVEILSAADETLLLEPLDEVSKTIASPSGESAVSTTKLEVEFEKLA